MPTSKSFGFDLSRFQTHLYVTRPPSIRPSHDYGIATSSVEMGRWNPISNKSPARRPLGCRSTPNPLRRSISQGCAENQDHSPGGARSDVRMTAHPNHHGGRRKFQRNSAVITTKLSYI